MPIHHVVLVSSDKAAFSFSLAGIHIRYLPSSAPYLRWRQDQIQALNAAGFENGGNSGADRGLFGSDSVLHAGGEDIGRNSRSCRGASAPRPRETPAQAALALARELVETVTHHDRLVGHVNDGREVPRVTAGIDNFVASSIRMQPASAGTSIVKRSSSPRSTPMLKLALAT